ncbi:integrase [Rhodococcus sp. NPDC127530]|uniref:integrase n=1 Tax=unclassified Rhodococcus (in: high G+C Gram-positive bacteria) TaxID=192944 RepID=UPI0036388B7C
MDDEPGCWTLDFYDFRQVFTAAAEDEQLHEFGDVHVRAERNGARHGTPILLSSSGEADPRINLFFRFGSVAARRPRTWRRYAFSLVVWLDFLATRGRSWDEATPADFDDFKYWRITDHRNLQRVRPTSFDTDRAGLNAFYDWAARYGVANPVPTRVVAEDQAQEVTSSDQRRDPMRPAGSPRRQVKWLLRSAFEQWRDIGLRGYGFDGRRRPGWRGFNEDRDAAFVDGLYGTGLRLTEWSSILDVELPDEDALGRFPKAWLTAACIKGGKQGRTYRIPRSVVKAIAAYMDPVEGSRVEAIQRARRQGRYDQLSGLIMVTGCNRHSRTVTVMTSSGSTPVALDVLGPEERLRLFRATDAGLEPLAVWLGNDGMPKQAHSWEKTFQTANKRIKNQWAAAHGKGDDHTVECPLWARPHMARHSYALKWFSILSVVWSQQLEGFTDREKRDLREQFGDVWFQLATLLGHSSPEVTKDWYLEPFAGLQVDYIFSLLDEEERAAVEQLVGKVVQDSDRVLTAVRLTEAPVPERAQDGGQ